MGRKIRDLSGMKFGRLTVLEPAGKIGRDAAFLCLCECGTEKVLSSPNLHGGTVSCGCYHRERASARAKENPPRLKHGGRKSITYTSWNGMVGRCLNPNNQNYHRYGGRGVVVCQRWSDPDTGFLNFVEDMGHRPTQAHSIDRIESSKGYEPGNCRWVTRAQQNQNVGLKKSNTSGYKGVLPRGEKWCAAIRCDGKEYYLGQYMTKERAALAYNIASERLHGPFGNRNSLPPMGRKETRFVFNRVAKHLSNQTGTGEL